MATTVAPVGQDIGARALCACALDAEETRECDSGEEAAPPPRLSLYTPFLLTRLPSARRVHHRHRVHAPHTTPLQMSTPAAVGRPTAGGAPGGGGPAKKLVIKPLKGDKRVSADPRVSRALPRRAALALSPRSPLPPGAVQDHPARRAWAGPCLPRPRPRLSKHSHPSRLLSPLFQSSTPCPPPSRPTPGAAWRARCGPSTARRPSTAPWRTCTG